MCLTCLNMDDCGLAESVVEKVDCLLENLIEDLDGLCESNDLDWCDLGFNLRRLVLQAVSARVAKNFEVRGKQDCLNLEEERIYKIDCAISELANVLTDVIEFNEAIDINDLTYEVRRKLYDCLSQKIREGKAK